MEYNLTSSGGMVTRAGRKLSLIIIVLLLTLSPCIHVFAHSDSASLSPQGLGNATDRGQFVDGLMQVQIDKGYSPGGVIAIVKNGEIIYAQGYGYADVENRTPVVADETLFRIGSCSKAFTATASMQLVEQGKLSLDTDVNTYLKDFQVPNNSYGPITLRELTTNSAGFEVQDACGRSVVIDPAKMPSLHDYIAHDMPARTRPAGEATSYSNYGVALEGYLVEQASGVPYDQYMDQNIFAPLGMHNSTSRQPVPDGLAAHLAKGYFCTGSGYRAGSFEYVIPAPSGSISATATDIAHYLIARLHDGKYDNGNILNQSTAAMMLTREFSNDPRLNGMAYGMVEYNINERRVLIKYGDTLLFNSFICLLPGEDLGIFVAFNGDQGSKAYMNVLQGFFDHYYPPGSPAVPVSMAGYRERAPGYAGTYYSTRTAYTTIEKVIGGVSQQYTVVANPNGTISVAGYSFIEVQPGYFEQLNGTMNMVFRDSPDGKTRYLFVGSDPEGGSLVKAAWYETAGFHAALLTLCLLTFLSALIAWPVAWLLRRRKHQAPDRGQMLARWAAALACALDIGFIAGILLLLATSFNDLAYGIPPTLLVVLTLPIVAATLTIVAIGFTALAWHRHYWSLPGRIHYTLVAIALVAFLWSVNFWNLIGYKL
jgi:CubicO group peptidase (beta-lactamase class C family)